MPEMPETVIRRVREWLRQVIDSDPKKYQNVDESAVTDEVDTQVSSDANIAGIAKRYGFPTPDALKLMTGAGKSVALRAELLDEEMQQQQAREAQRGLIGQINDVLQKAGVAEEIRELIDLRLVDFAKKFPESRDLPAKVEQLEARIRESEKKQKALREAISARPAAPPAPAEPAKPSARDAFAAADARERPFRVRLDDALADGNVQKNEAQDFFRRLNAEKERVRKLVDVEKTMTVDDATVYWSGFLDGLNDELSAMIEKRKLRVEPIVRVEMEKRAPPPRAPTPGAPGGPPPEVAPGVQIKLDPVTHEAFITASEEVLFFLEKLLPYPREYYEASPRRKMEVFGRRDLDDQLLTDIRLVPPGQRAFFTELAKLIRSAKQKYVTPAVPATTQAAAARWFWDRYRDDVLATGFREAWGKHLAAVDEGWGANLAQNPAEQYFVGLSLRKQLLVFTRRFPRPGLIPAMSAALARGLTTEEKFDQLAHLLFRESPGDEILVDGVEVAIRRHPIVFLNRLQFYGLAKEWSASDVATLQARAARGPDEGAAAEAELDDITTKLTRLIASDFRAALRRILPVSVPEVMER